MIRVGRLALAASWLCLGCSADHAPEPEPGFATPGAFVALVDGSGQMALVRSLALVPIQNAHELLFCILYAEQPSSFAHARELAQQGSLTIGETKFTIWSDQLEALEHEVVWFRTLTDEEQTYLR
jgi:hypothetical protein